MTDPDKRILKSDVFHEKCGIFGVYGKGLEAARLTYFGLYALQHRGQDGSGISSSNGKRIVTYKETGLVTQVYTEDILKKLTGHIAIGHNRYPTSGGTMPEHNQPVAAKNDIVSLVHNGNLPITKKLRRFLSALGIYTKIYNDSELMHLLIRYYLVKKYPLEEAIRESVPLFTGAYSLLVMTSSQLVALRDPFGIRPLSIGKLNGGYVVSSETCALDTVNATFLKDVEPGEMVIIDKNGLRSIRFAKANQKLDIFEFVYFARPDSVLLGKRVYEIRKNFGKKLAQEHPIKADVVIPVPDSSIPAALGYAEALHIPFEYGLVKNRYIGRTFILPEQRLRDRGVQMKLNPISELIKGKRVALVDDSIVRGTTSKRIVEMIRQKGAKEVHVLSSCPPVKFPDFYGVDTPLQKELIANKMTKKQMATFMNADSVSFLSYKGLLEATGIPEEKFCTSCFTGEYPIDIGTNAKKITGAKILKQTYMKKRQEHIAVLVSNKGTGSNLLAIIQARKKKKIKANISLVISDKSDALGLQHAKKYRIPSLVRILHDKEKREQYGKELAQLFNRKNITIAVLAGFSTILPTSYFTEFKGITLNIHPGLIPDEKNKPFRFPDGTPAPWNQGLMANSAVKNFLKRHYAGSTIHIVTQEADFGPVLERRIIKTKPNDTVEKLYQRLKKEEHKGLIQSINKLSLLYS